jgi:glyoxylase-like metal-dependent hydrolase (beta-lactamase superfamily II)
MTAAGTNTYVLGDDRLVVIDPGPLDTGHLARLLGVVARRPVDAIIVTHSHLDHSALAPELARATGARIMGFGDSLAGRSVRMQALAAQGLIGGGEGIDHSFRADQKLADGDAVQTSVGPITVRHMPGHFGNHICLLWGHTVFSGDHVMEWSTSLVSPPDGDLSDYMASLRKLAAVPAGTLLPGHGAKVADPAARIAELIAHRLSREAQILAALGDGPATVSSLTARLYVDVPPGLHPAAARNVLAHLVDLEARNIILAEPAVTTSALFRRI